MLGLKLIVVSEKGQSDCSVGPSTNGQRAYHPSRYQWGHSLGMLGLSLVIATHLEINHPYHLRVDQSSNVSMSLLYDSTQTWFLTLFKFDGKFVLLQYISVGCCSWRYPSEIHLKLKSREISFAHNLFLRQPIVLKISQITTVMLFAKFGKYWKFDVWV